MNQLSLFDEPKTVEVCDMVLPENGFKRCAKPATVRINAEGHGYGPYLYCREHANAMLRTDPAWKEV